MIRSVDSSKTVTEAIDTARFSWAHGRLVLVCALLMVIDGYDMIAYGSVVQHLMLDWGISPAQAGWVASAALFGMLVGGLAIAPLADRWGRRPMLVGTLLASCVLVFACALSVNVLTLVLARFLMGAALGALVANLVALVSETVPRRSRALMVCLVGSAYSIGGILAAVLAIWLVPAVGWRSVFVVGGVLALAMVPVVRRLPESPSYLAARPDRNAELLRQLETYAPGVELSVEVPLDRPEPQRASAADLFRHGNAVATVLIWFVFAMTMLLSYGLNTWLPALMTSAGYPLSSGLVNLVTLNAGGILGALVGGHLADRFGVRRVMLLFFVLAAASIAALGTDPGQLVLNLLLVVAGATTIGGLAVIHAVAAEHYPARIRATGVGWAAGMGRVGAILGPVLGGALLQLSLPFQQNFVAVAVPGAVGALAVLLLARRPWVERGPVVLADSPTHSISSSDPTDPERLDA